jgi:hypothetical protein
MILLSLGLTLIQCASRLDALHDSAARERALESIPTTVHPELVDLVINSFYPDQCPAVSPSSVLIAGPKSNLAGGASESPAWKEIIRVLSEAATPGFPLRWVVSHEPNHALEKGTMLYRGIV